MTHARRIHPELPIFRLAAGGREILYTPGHVALVATDEADALQDSFSNGDAGVNPHVAGLATRLLRLSARSSEAWRDLSEKAFEPECLTIYLSNDCNLGCSYCYSAGDDGRRGAAGGDRAGRWPIVEEHVVAAAATVVARSCARRGKRFVLVLHGGGEPTLHWGLLQRIVGATRRIADAHGIDWWGYIATNGVFSTSRARWLARSFNRIGLSCDGPPAIHDRQRPSVGGRGVSGELARTARILHEMDTEFTVRVTVTPESLRRQAEIVAYVQQELGAREIKLEPVYLAKPGQRGFRPADAPEFVRHFLAAQTVARELGCVLTLSGVRLDEIHGPYCNVLRQVLHLTPDGAATACFLCTDSRRAPDAELAVGRLDPSTGEFVLSRDRIDALRRRAARIPARCEACVNIYHCARDCPDVCPVLGGEDDPQRPGGFRCQVQKALGETWIRQAVATTPSRAGVAATAPIRREEARVMASFLAEAPPEVDVEALTRRWQRIQDRFAIRARSAPRPPWALRGFDQDGSAAWRQIAGHYPGQPCEAPLSVYIHIPFCDRRCGFCDCHMLKMRPENGFLEEKYVAALTREIDAWSGIAAVSQRPLTTVHFGGGTPSYLSERSFERILASLTRFHPTPATEWALESTSSQLDAARLARLKEWGFRRLHVGVQTLEDPVRSNLGRQEPAAAVLGKLEAALRHGFVVTVDLVSALPGQSVRGFARDLAQLCEIGIHGFSVYPLNETSRNRRFVQRHGGRQPMWSYLFLHLAEEALTRRGYRKNHFVHFALPEDRNLYYTHARRGEDLLALGMSADGIFGHYRYRHPGFRAYLEGTDRAAPALEGGHWESALERKTRKAAAQLMSATVGAATLTDLGVGWLLEEWLDRGLLRPDSETSDYVLTANGSWCLTEMLAALNRAIGAPRAPAATAPGRG